MKRFALPLIAPALLALLSGCGDSAKPGVPDTTGVPNEVQEYEKRREMERTKGVAPPPPPAPNGGGFAPR